MAGLQSSYQVHGELGIRGRETVQKNQFGDIALRADIEMEQVIIEILNQAAIPVKVVSEEHGIVMTGKPPVLLGILDGLDGSSVYKQGWSEGGYGTMFGLFSNINPVYEEYLCCGVMIHAPQPRLVLATKGLGCFVLADGVKKPANCRYITQLSEAGIIYIDEYFAVNRETFSRKLQGFNTRCLNSSAVHYADVATGMVDAALECTRKRNLELAVAYGLITEAGGVMLGLDSVSLAQKPYFTFGQDMHIPVVTAATRELALDIIRQVVV